MVLGPDKLTRQVSDKLPIPFCAFCKRAIFQIPNFNQAELVVSIGGAVRCVDIKQRLHYSCEPRPLLILSVIELGTKSRPYRERERKIAEKGRK